MIEQINLINIIQNVSNETFIYIEFIDNNQLDYMVIKYVIQ